ncbi:hypothetical protein BH24ACI2_BH24ACI2_09990 [soil metagenome]|jgi:hypothetical protein
MVNLEKRSVKGKMILTQLSNHKISISEKQDFYSICFDVTLNTARNFGKVIGEL